MAPGDRPAKTPKSRDDPLVGGVAAIGFAAIAAALVGWNATGRHPSELISWIEGIGAIGTLLAAVTAGVFAARAYRLETDRDAKRAEIDERRQASLVSAWTAYERMQVMGRPQNMSVLKLRNASEAPVYDMVIHARPGREYRDHPYFDGMTFTDDVGVVPPDDAPQTRIFPPIVVGTVKTTEAQGLNPRQILDSYDVTLRFTDASGVDWERAANGRLSPRKR